MCNIIYVLDLLPMCRTLAVSGLFELGLVSYIISKLMFEIFLELYINAVGSISCLLYIVLISTNGIL